MAGVPVSVCAAAFPQVKRAWLIGSLLLVASILHAGDGRGWLLPELASSTYLTPHTELSSWNPSVSVLSCISASFNAGGKLEAGLGYDIIDKNLVNCELVWRPLDWLHVRAGIQRSIYLYETTYSPRYLEAVGYSQSALYLGGYSRDLSGKNSRSRDCGITLEGALGQKFTYAIGVFNGNGYSFQDDNKAKDIAARFVFKPADGLKLSLAGMKGWISDGEGLSHRDRISIAAWYDGPRIFARAENILGRTGTLLSDGVFLLAGYWINERMALSARYDRFQADLSQGNTARTNLDCCFTHMLLRKDISYRVQYTHTFLSSSSDRNLLSVCLILRFSSSL